MNDLISVIVPVYKVEDYLDKCIESIVNQTYRDLEIILVDDGSPDNCPAMCDAWAEKDSRIKVIHKENGGLSDARNAGLRAANGEYIAFVDSDDSISSDMYEKLYKSITHNNCDIASCTAVRVWEDGRSPVPLTRTNRNIVLNKNEAMNALIDSTYLVMTVWNKLYKASIVTNIPFEVGKIHEDEFWTWKAIANAGSVSVIEDICYYYLQRNNSIMGLEGEKYPLLVLQAKAERHEYIRKELPSLTQKSSMDIIYTCVFKGYQVLKSADKDKQKILMSQLNEYVLQYKPDDAYIKALQPIKQIRLRFIIKHFKFDCFIRVKLGMG